MSCKKYQIINTGATNVYITFRKCEDGAYEYNKEIIPFRIYNLWTLDGIVSSAERAQIAFEDEGEFPPTTTTTTTPSSPTPTPTVTDTPTPTPTVTDTPTPTPTLTPTPSPIPFSPDIIPDLWGWYSSDSGVTSSNNGNYQAVSQWDDKSINGNNLLTYLTNTPELTTGTVGTLSTQYVRKSTFNTASMRTSVNFPDITSTDVTIFAVSKMNSISGFAGDTLLKADDGIAITNLNTPDRLTGRVGVNTPTTLTAAYTLGSWVTIRLESSGATQSLSINNNIIDSSNDVSHLYLGNNKLQILANGAGQPADASFAEILIYVRNLTNTEINQVETYLKNKYNHY